MRDDADNDAAADEADVGYAEKLMQSARQQKKRRVENSKYQPTAHVVSTSNIVERLFSHAKLILSSLCRSMHPETLNMLLFLKANRHLWPDAMIIQLILDDEGDDDDEIEDSEEEDDM